MTSQRPKISLEEAMQAVRQVLDAWPARPRMGDWSRPSWDAYRAAETEAVAPLIALGAVISEAHPATGRRMRFGGVSTTCTSGMHGLITNWMGGARRRVAKDRT